MRPLLIAAAWEPELAALPILSGVECAVVGVGLVEAAAGAARVLEAVKPRAVILVGTAGVYPALATKLPSGRIAVSRTITLASLSVARAAAYFPPPVPTSVATTPVLRRELATCGSRIPQADVACPLGITRSAAAARTLADATGAALENLEAFAVARASAAAGIPFAAVLGVANVVGPRAHAQWRTHGPAAAAAACARVAAWLTGAKPGRRRRSSGA